MKIVSHSSQLLAVNSEKKFWTHSKANPPTALPSAFLRFLEDFDEPIETQELHLRDDNQVAVNHGRCGSQVIWTRDSPLPGSWRVDARHSNRVVALEAFDPSNLESADGLAVAGENFSAPLAIQTADCLAVSVTTERDCEICFASCFHAGWRGFAAGIQHNAWSLLRSTLLIPSTDHPSRSAEVFFTIGPAIAGSRYPCGEDVLAALRKHHAQRLRSLPGWSSKHEQAFWEIVDLEKYKLSGKIYPDLQTLMCVELHSYGVPLSAITIFRDDTFGSCYWPSHRRAMAQGLPRAGRLITHLCPSNLPTTPKPC